MTALFGKGQKELKVLYLLITLISQAGIRKLELRFTRFERGVE